MSSKSASGGAEAIESILGRMKGFVYRCAVDEGFTMLYISPSIKNVIGHGSADLMTGAVSFAELVVHEDRAPTEAIVGRAVQARAEYEVEYRMLHRDGRQVWVTEQGVGVYGPDGALRYIEGFVFNAEGRRAAELKDKERMSALSSVTKDILSDTDTILGLLKTLSILSFNARVEAARAGDAGRGFAAIGEHIARLAGEADSKARKLDGYLAKIRSILSS